MGNLDVLESNIQSDDSKEIFGETYNLEDHLIIA